MIATTKVAALMAATILAAGFSVAPFLPGAEAGPINTSRSNLKSAAIGQQEADQSCINQAQGQGGQQAVSNPEQNTISERGDPVPDIDVKMGRNPGGSAAAPGISSEGDPTVNAEQSNECSIAMDQTVEQNGDTEDFSTNEWTE